MQRNKKIIFCYESLAGGETIASRKIVEKLSERYKVTSLSHEALKKSSFIGYFSWLVRSFSFYAKSIKKTKHDVFYATTYTAFLAYVFYGQKNKILIFHYHGNRVQSFAFTLNFFKILSRIIKLFFSYWFNFTALKNATIIMVPSEHTKFRISKIFLLNKKKIKVIPNGVDPLLFKFTLPKNKNAITVLCVGSMNSKKNFHQVMEVFNLIKSSEKKLIISYHQNNYEKNYLKFLKKKAKDLKIDKLVSFVKNGKMNTLYNKSSLVISLSKEETFQLIMLEALSSGKPFFTTHPSSKEVLQMLSFKTFIKYKSNKEIANYLEKYIKLKLEKKLEIANNSKSVAKQFTWGKIVEKIIKIIED